MPRSNTHAKTSKPQSCVAECTIFKTYNWTYTNTSGVDPVIVQRLAGHTDIRTTRRYAHFSPSFAAKQILKVQREESMSLRQRIFGFEVGVGPKQDQSVDELERLYALQPGK
jgi:hypothetical protein